jgi:hypothetical protein
MVLQTELPEAEILSRMQAAISDEPTEPAEEKITQETKEEPKVEAPDDVTPQVETEEPDPIAADASDEEPVVSESELATGAETSQDEINTVSDLAKMFEVDETELLDHLQIDTDAGQVPLSKVISTFKNAPAAVQQWETLKKRELEIEAESTQMRAKTDEQLRTLAAHTQLLLNMTEEEFKDVDWKRLEVEDPSHYLILRDRKRERQQTIANSIDQMKGVEQGRSQEYQEAATRGRAAEIASLHEQKPEWKEPEVAKAAMADTNSYLLEIGYTQEVINNILDHRQIIVAYEAAQYRKLKKQAPKKLQTLRDLPKPKGVLRASARRDTASSAQKTAQKNFDRLKQTGSEEDAARIFEELL